MLRLTGAAHVLDTVYALAGHHVRPDKTGALTPASLKRALHARLCEIQPDIARPSPDTVVYLSEGAEHARLVRTFNAPSELDDTTYHVESPVDYAENVGKLKRIQEGIETLRARDPLWAQVFELSMFAVFAAPCEVAGAGTSSHALGVLWVDPRDRWSRRDIEEVLVHELAHMLLFYEELRYGLFTSPEEMLAPEHYALSAIRAAPRPLDKSLHSVIVATEVVLARDAVLGHPSDDGLHPTTGELIRGTLASIDSIFEHAASVLMPRSRALMEDCRDQLERMTTEVTA